ncbi:MAG TPA: hypothetical protein VF970_14825, partial [Gemmatimonadales bacterium]
MRHRARTTTAWLVGWSAVGLASTVHAQDLELTAHMTGRTLPAEYYALIARDPGFFTVKRGWGERAAAARARRAAVTGALSVAVVQALFGDSPSPAIPVS